MTTARRPRVALEQRREQILAAALREFSHKGLHGGSTVTIAKDVEISHPNLFRVFSTKQQLFRAVLEQAFDQIVQRMVVAGEAAGDEALQVMTDAWGVLMEDRDLMLILLQGYAACDDPEIRELMHERTQEVFERTEVLPAIGTDLAHDFLAAGMFYMVAAAMDLPARAEKDEWAGRFLDSGR
ncbi:TetR/AcrR family transcriptional regulator [Kribbella italica]|uniref:AcrR family transcriptional regulator n=1 Tax=Kribbella italica TaxID=1540520 RepID=A0A7W9J6B6_9ACTN|nr:TetR/AcrR family transcriptional regulator [Kribbella italica]MBB5836210.1 AcrR family transcriptional regulator [Kribbella italica]